MIVMELMSTSLRSQLQKDEYFMPPLVKSISLDVARALTDLHQIQPDAPIEQLPLSKWRAKVTDCGFCEYCLPAQHCKPRKSSVFSS